MNISKAQNTMDSFINKSFKYGQFDCLIFAIKTLESFHEMTIDLPIIYDGSRKSIVKLFKYFKAKTLDQLVENYCIEKGYKKISKNFLQPFDLLILNKNNENLFAIWDGEKALSIYKIGYGVIFDSNFVSAFRIKRGI